MNFAVRVLTPVWGPRYVEIFLGTGLPSMLSARNLPMIAAEFPCEFVFLTREIDADLIRRHPAFAALERVCTVKFLFIDDLLLPGMEGFVLTLAFSRGLHDVGPKMVDTYFIFMNADFVVSDGAYESLLKYMKAGHRAIVAPSLRCASEDAFPTIARKTDQVQHTLTLSSREMVGLTLDNLHPTAVANILDGNFVFNSVTNQFFWWVDRNTLVGHFFLLFMMCIRPERELTDIPGFCDYTFVPEMCPNSKLVVIRDSDECFLMELQGRDQELQFLRFGQPSLDTLTEHLSEWTTAYHRSYSREPILFHAADRPPSVDAIEAKAAAFMATLHKGMDPTPQPTRNHPYWLGARMAERRRRNPADLPSESLESGALQQGLWARLKTWLAVSSGTLAQNIYYAMAGRPPLVNIWHYDWQDYRATVPILREAMKDPAARIAYVAGGSSRFDSLLSELPDRCIRIEADDLLSRESVLPAVESFGPANYCIAYLGGRHAAKIGEMISRITEITSGDARITIMIRDESFESFGSSFARLLFRQVRQIRTFEFFVRKVHVNGGTAKVLVRDAILKRADKIGRHGIFRSPGAMFGLALLVPATFLINLVARLRRPMHLDDLSCSSLILDIEKRGG